MACLTYEDEDTNGHTIRQTVTADDRYMVYDIVRANSYSIASVQEA